MKLPKRISYFLEDYQDQRGRGWRGIRAVIYAWRSHSSLKGYRKVYPNGWTNRDKM